MSVRFFEIPAFAKINLSLRVTGRRPDGYHELDTVFQNVDLADRLRISVDDSDNIELRVEHDNDPMFRIPDDDSNLVVSAARGFVERWARGRGVSIVLEKRIPVGSGLGGGSSDAASTLLCLRALLRPELVDDDLYELAAELGSDVPFFLVGGTARGTGRGDVVRPMVPIEPTELVLAVAPCPVSTAKVFDEYARRTSPNPTSIETGAAAESIPRTGSADQSISAPTFDALVTGNDLQSVAFDLYETVAHVYTAFQQSQFHSVQLSGSGGCVFGRFPVASGEQAFADWKASLPADTRVYRVRTLTADEVREHLKLST